MESIDLNSSQLPIPNRAAPPGGPTATPKRILKRNGQREPVRIEKLVASISRCATRLDRIDPQRVADQIRSGLYDGASTEEIDRLAIQTAAALTAEEPEYSKLAARLIARLIDKEVKAQNIQSFSQSIDAGVKSGLINERLQTFVQVNARKLDQAITPARDDLFEYFGLRTLYDRYLLKHPQRRKIIENPQHFFMRIACALTAEISDALDLYDLLSSLEYLPSSPTLFNAGTQKEQLSSCFLLDSPKDSLEAIYDRYKDVAALSKFSGGIGQAYHRVRAKGSLIEGTNGLSNGIVPWLKTLDASVAAVNQGGRRKGACCVYLESWHNDVEDFLELKENTGDEARRAHNLNLANWVPDLFMKRVEEDGQWSLFDPARVPQLCDLYGEAFEEAYVAAETEGRYTRQVRARDLYARMMRTLAQTGNGWMTFKDACNRTCNQVTPKSGETVHLSNLCTEIIEVTGPQETAVCNLGSINLARHMTEDGMDWSKLHRTVRLAVKQLDAVIDLNYYPIEQTARSNARWRPVGLGLMGLQDVFFALKLPFDSPRALELSTRISEEIYFAALSTSCELAKDSGAHPGFAETRAAQGELQFDLWGKGTTDPQRWAQLKEDIRTHGLRNSLLIAIAPTATIASLAGCYECIEPQVSNLFKRETLSGEFLQVNRYLVEALRAQGLWTEEIRAQIKVNEGSVASIPQIPAQIRDLFRTAWELPMRAVIDMAAARGAFIDQSQSLNLFQESPQIGPLSAMYFYAWKAGLKTTYYLRSRPATRIRQATMTESQRALACSLENPESCEACQ